MTAEGAVMQAETLLRDITEYCRRTGVAESTFGRLAVNDGKFVNRLRDGGRITTTTLERVRSFIAADPGRQSLLVGGAREGTPEVESATASSRASAQAIPDDRYFRFF